MELEGLKSGVIIEDPFFPEPVKIIQVQPLENGAIQIQGVGTVERKFYDPVLSPEDLAKLKLFTDLDLLEESVHKKENLLCLRRLKEDLKDFSGKPLFPPRKVFTPRFELNLGYDIRSEDDQGNVRYIEVKARARTGAITLTANEWFMAWRLQDEYWLYIVENAGSENPELYTIQNPTSRFKPEEVIGVVSI